MPAKKSRGGPAQATCRYAYAIDLDSDTTAAKVVRLVGQEKRVLELGCATGHMSSVLRERGCQVVGIEISAEAAEQARAVCERVIVGDLRQLDLKMALGDDRFDVILAADVLEHVEEPTTVLRALTPYLRPDGYVVASIPNVAHGSVRLALLGGSFPYSDLGLLDRTHLRFFTRESVVKLFDDAGLVIGHFERQERKIEESEVPFSRESVPPDLMEALAADPEARTYQYLIVACPASDAVRRRMRELDEAEQAARHEGDAIRQQVAALTQEVVSLRQANEQERTLAQHRIAALAEERDAAVQRAEEARAEAEERSDLRSAVVAMWDELRRVQDVIRAELGDIKTSLERPRGDQASGPEERSLAAKYREYQQLVERVRDAVRRAIPFGATVAVVNKGDKQLLELDGRRGWHFPRQDDGGYTGYYPADGEGAIKQVEAARAAGAEYLLFPSSALWWLDHYAGLRQHLEQRYRPVVKNDTCVIFALRGSEAERRGQAIGEDQAQRYRQLTHQIRQVVCSILPNDATVAVVSRGDAELLNLDVGKARHFPCAEDGTYAGYYPADSAEAIEQVEAAHATGVEYLLFPSTAFWWLDHYHGLREHLERQYRVVMRQQHVCFIFALQGRRVPRTSGDHRAIPAEHVIRSGDPDRV